MEETKKSKKSETEYVIELKLSVAKKYDPGMSAKMILMVFSAMMRGIDRLSPWMKQTITVTSKDDPEDTASEVTFASGEVGTGKGEEG